MPIIKTQKGVSVVLPYMHTMLKANCREVSSVIQSEIIQIYAVTGMFYVLLLTYHCVRL